MMLEFPFERGIKVLGTLYIKLDNGKMYRLYPDYSMTEAVKWEETITEENIKYSRKYPEKAVYVVCVYKEEFEREKSRLMDKQSPQRISHEKAKWFHQLGFITKEELNDYLNKAKNVQPIIDERKV